MGSVTKLPTAELGFPIPEIALEQHQAILGKTGSGKSSTAKLIVEHVVAQGARVCILDPIKSDWWGITSSADGNSPGLPFQILGGPHGHVPLHASAGKAIGQLVASGELPLSVIDMADFAPGGMAQFFVDFAPMLLGSAKRGVLYLVLEEAHEFAPKERSGIGAENMSVYHAKRLATAGRSKGIRLIVVSHRVQALHNAVLGSCDTLIVQRLTAPADQEPVVKWLKANTDKTVREQVEGSLSSLPTGTGWICSGEARVFEKVKFPLISTYDNTATPTGDDEVREVKTAPVDRDRLRLIIGDAVKVAEANDPKILKAEIARLKTELGQKVPTVAAAADPAAIEAARADGFSAGVDEGIKRGVADGIGIGITQARDALAALAMPTRLAPMPAPAPRPPVPRPVAAPPKLALNVGLGGLTGPQIKIVRSLSMWLTLGHQAPTKPMVAAVAGYSHGSGGFGNLLGQLRASGWIDYPSPGQIALRHAPMAMTVEEGLAMLLGTLSNPHMKIVAALRGTDGMTKAALGEATGYSPTSGGFGNLLGQLRSKEIVTYPSPGFVALSDWFKQIYG